MTPMMRSYCPATRTRTPGWTGPRCPVSSEESSLILSSSESESSGGKTSSGGNKSGSGKDGEADEEADRSSSEPESETLIYQSDRETIRDKLFSAMLAGYGVIGLGVAWQIYLHTIRKK